MNRLLLVPLLALAACTPALRPLEPFVERRPDPILDQGAHRAPVEWWYLNGHLESSTGRYGFATAFFQVLLPPETRYGLVPLQALFPGPLFFGHASLVDKTTGAFRFDERSTLPFDPGAVPPGQASASTERMDVRLGDWRTTREPDGAYTLRTSVGSEVLELRLVPERPEVAHGPGWSGTPETGRMYYTSATRLRATGTLGGETVEGIAWLDHQWGGEAGGSASVTPRWDWFSLQLDDGRDLMVYRLRDAAGRPLSPFVSVVDARGEVSASSDIVLSPFRYWTSPETGARYPVAWFLRLEDGTSLTITAVTDAQELVTTSAAGIPYYEGAVDVRGSVRGVGYMELTGYAPDRPNPFTDPGAYFRTPKP